MTKKVIDFNRLPKQEYQKPVMKVIELQHKSQILVGSVTTTGLDDEDKLILPDGEEGGSVWGEAW